MRTITLLAEEDPNIDAVGLIVKGLGMDWDSSPNVANTGELIAHDLLEHQNGIHMIGSLDDEAEAFGAMWYIRAQFGEFRPAGKFYPIVTCEDSMSDELADMEHKYLYRGFETPVPKTRYTMFEASFEYIKDEVFQKLRREIIEKRSEMGNQQCRNNLKAIKEYSEAIMHYMTRGACRAHRRFKDPYVAHDMFWEIANAVEPYASSPEEGQRFRLRYARDGAECYEIIEDEFMNWSRYE